LINFCFERWTREVVACNPGNATCNTALTF
jgi:hypothetical protein